MEAINVSISSFFFQHEHRHRYQSMSTECPAKFSGKKREKKEMLTEQKGLVTKSNSISVPHLRGFYI